MYNASCILHERFKLLQLFASAIILPTLRQPGYRQVPQQAPPSHFVCGHLPPAAHHLPTLGPQVICCRSRSRRQIIDLRSADYLQQAPALLCRYLRQAPADGTCKLVFTPFLASFKTS